MACKVCGGDTRLRIYPSSMRVSNIPASGRHSFIDCPACNKPAPVPALTADGFDSAIVGVITVLGQKRMVYDSTTCIGLLAADMPYDDAVEYFEFNVLGAYVGPGTPLFMYPYDADTIGD